MSITRLVSFAGALTLVLIVLVAPARGIAPPGPFPAASIDDWVGQPAAPHDFEHVVHGASLDQLTLEALRGHTVVLEFWATWCAPCLAAMPHLAELEQAFADDPVTFILVTAETPEVVSAFMAKRPLPGTVVVDADASVAQAYRVGGIPQTVVVDGSGTVALATRPMDLDAKTLRSIVDGTYEITPRAAAAAAATRANPIAGEPFPFGPISGGWDPLVRPHFDSGLVDPRVRPWTTIVRPTLVPDPEYAMFQFGSPPGAGMTVLASSVDELIRTVYGVRWRDRLIDEIGLDRDPTLYDVIISRPDPFDTDDVRDELGHVLRTLFGYDVVIESSEQPVLVVDVSERDPEHVLTVDERRARMQAGERISGRSFLNLLQRLVELNGLPIVGTDGRDLHDTCFGWFVTKPNVKFTADTTALELLELLESLGIALEPSEATIETVRVRDASHVGREL